MRDYQKWSHEWVKCGSERVANLDDLFVSLAATILTQSQWQIFVQKDTLAIYLPSYLICTVTPSVTTKTQSLSAKKYYPGVDLTISTKGENRSMSHTRIVFLINILNRANKSKINVYVIYIHYFVNQNFTLSPSKLWHFWINWWLKLFTFSCNPWDIFAY